MSKFGIFCFSFICIFKAHALSKTWDFHYSNSYCDMSLSDSYYTEEQNLFGYVISFKFLGKNHVNANELLTKTPMLHVLPSLLTKAGTHLNAEQLSLNGFSLNSALSSDAYTGEKVLGILDDLLSGKPVVGVAEFSDGTTTQWTFNTKDIQVNGALFKVCMDKST